MATSEETSKPKPAPIASIKSMKRDERQIPMSSKANNEAAYNSWKLFGFTLLGVVIGYLVFNDSGQRASLQAELDNYKRLAAGSLSSNSFTVRPRRSNPGAIANRTAQQPKSSQAHTREEFLNRTKAFDVRVREEAVARQSERDRAEYMEVFGKLGVPPALADDFREKLRNIHNSTILASGAEMEALEAKYKYLKEVQSSMTPENFALYKAYEEAKPARVELENIQKYLQTQQKVIDPEATQSVLALIQSTSAYTGISELGPFQEVLVPSYGNEAVATRLEQEIERISASSEQLQRQAQQIGVPTAIRQYLADYYAQFIQGYRTQIVRARLPEGERARIIADTMEQMRTKRLAGAASQSAK